MSQGKVVQIIGAVVDLEFPQDAVPKVYDALKVTEGGLEGLVLEVQQQLLVELLSEHPFEAGLDDHAVGLLLGQGVGWRKTGVATGDLPDALDLFEFLAAVDLGDPGHCKVVVLAAGEHGREGQLDRRLVPDMFGVVERPGAGQVE